MNEKVVYMLVTFEVADSESDMGFLKLISLNNLFKQIIAKLHVLLHTESCSAAKVTKQTCISFRILFTYSKTFLQYNLLNKLFK